MAKRKRKMKSEFAVENGVLVSVYGDDVGTAERHQHDPIRETDTLIDGKLKRVSRTIDLMGRMRKNGTITAMQARAGRRFRNDFDVANFDPRQAPDLGRVPCQGKHVVSDNVQAARDRLWDALEALGGHSSPAGTVAWYTLGVGYSITQWCDIEAFDTDRPVKRDTGRGILIASLGVLSMHYGYER